MKRFLIAFLTSIASISYGAFFTASEKNVLELHQVKNKVHSEQFRAVAAMVDDENLSIENDKVRIRHTKTGLKLNLCPDQKFYSDSTFSSCTGFLIAGDILLTAGHCLGFSEKEAEHNCVTGEANFFL